MREKCLNEEKTDKSRAARNSGGRGSSALRNLTRAVPIRSNTERSKCDAEWRVEIVITEEKEKSASTTVHRNLKG